jgi:bacteriocin resistance YdeI/OmpD-like protein/uncharacterized protein DUF1905
MEGMHDGPGGARRFQATLAGSEKGRVYVLLPFDPAEAWGPRTRYDVRGTLGGCRFRGTLAQSGQGHFVPLGPAWRRDNGLGPGDEVEVVIAAEPGQRDGLPADVAAALAAEPGAASFYDTLAGFYRKAYLRWIEATKRRPDVRAARIAELVELLKAGYKQRPG